MALTITNQILQPANKGQGVLITAFSSNGFDSIAVGQRCELDSNGKDGVVEWVDAINNQIKIVPQYPYSNLATSAYTNVCGVDDVIIYN
jgi:hypothetical protein